MGRNSSRKSSSKTASKAAANKADAGNGSAAGAVADASPDAALQQGIAAAVRGDKDAAYKIFSETVELYPSVPEAWVWLGGTSPNLDNAETAFEKAYTLDPNNEQASLGLRWVRLQRKAALNGMMAPATAASETPSWSEMVSYAAPAEVANAGGQAATVQCPNCGKENSRTEKFCEDCGQQLNVALAVTNAGFIEPVAVKRDYSKYLIAIGVVLLVLVLLAGIWYIATPR